MPRSHLWSKNTDYWNGVERATHDFYYKKKQPLFLIKANTTEERLGSSTYFPLKRNTDYVVSFKGFASENVSSYDIFILARKYGETNSYSSIKHLVDAKRLSGSSVQYVKDLVFNSGENDEAYFRIDNNGSSDGTDAWLFFTEVKVEEGNKSTAWTPAPEDERQRVDNITSQLSARITATSQQFSSYYTKAETDNRTNSAKNDAINSIKNDGNWQGLSNILTNSGFLQIADGFLQKVQQTAQPMIDANNGGGINLVKMSGFHNVTIDQLMPCWNIGNDIFINTKGGRNATGSIVIDARNISDSLREFTQWIDLEPNTDYHLSFHLLFVELAANSSFSAYTYLTEYDDQGNTTYPYRDNGRLIVNTNDRSQNSFTIHTGNTTKKGLLYVRAMKGTKIELEEIKLEKGHIGTPWSPAPSDFATQISFSELSQSLDGLRSIVGSNYGNLQSQISQSSSAVRTELNDRINGVDNKTTSTANSLNSVIGRVGSLENLTNIRVVNNAINANDYTNTGNYFIQSTDNINVPGTKWCYLKVEKVNDGRIVQTWQADSDPTLRYSRTKLDDSWTQWQRSASYSEYSELNRTVQGLQSTVSSNYGQLQNIISQTDQATRNEINDKVNGLQGQLTLQANDFNVALNNLQVGGTNLVRNSGDFQTMDYWSGTRLSLTKHQFWKNGKENLLCIANSSATQENLLSSSYFDVKPNTTYTISFWVFHDSNLRDYDVYFLGRKYGSPNGFDVVMQLVAGAKASSAYASYVTKQFNTGNSDEGYLRFDNDAALNDGQDTTLYLADIKVEEGDKATAWSPSPYDQVAKDRILAQINMSAGTTLIQNDKIYMDASSTVFSGNAFIPSAAITSLNADKITTGTLNAANVNIINLNANNITTGTINGQNLKIDLNTGNVEFQHGRIHNFSNTVDINLDQNYISTANYNTRALLKDGELQLTQPNLYDTNGNWYFRLYNGGGAGDAWAGASLIGRDSVIVANEGNAQGATGFTSSPMGTATFSGLFTGKGTNNWMPTILGGAERGVFIKGGNQMSIKQNVMDPNDGGVFATGSPFISVGVDGPNNNWWGNRIVIDGEYLHVPTAWRHTTGGAPNLVVADDGAIVRSTSASKYKTEIHRDYSTKYGDRLLQLPTATWIDKGQKERYQKGERHIKPNKYFGMIAEDLADAGLDLLVSRNSQTHEIEGIQYERIGPALIPVIRKLKKKVQQLEEKLNEQ